MAASGTLHIGPSAPCGLLCSYGSQLSGAASPPGSPASLLAILLPLPGLSYHGLRISGRHRTLSS